MAKELEQFKATNNIYTVMDYFYYQIETGNIPKKISIVYG